MVARSSIVLSAVLALVPALAGARVIERGTWELSGGTELNISGTKLEPDVGGDVDETTVAVNGQVQYYLARNFGLGLFVSYENTELEFDTGLGTVTDETTTTVIGPIASFNLSLAPSASLMFGGGIVRMAVDTDAGDADGFSVLLAGGVKFFPASFVSLNGVLSYNFGSLEDDTGADADLRGWNLGVSVSVYLGGGR